MFFPVGSALADPDIVFIMPPSALIRLLGLKTLIQCVKLDLILSAGKKGEF